MSGLKRVLAFCLCLVLLAGFLPREAFAASSDATLVKKNGVWYYVKDGKVCYDTTLVKFNGSWWYVTGGKVASNATTLVKWSGQWWYVVNGKVASNTTTLVKFDGTWYYIVKGKVASNTTTLVKWNGSWWYIVKGKLASTATTLVKYNGSWWYIVKGKLASNTTTLAKYNGSWYYVNKGKVDFTSTTLVSFSGSWYYVKNGTTHPTAETLVKFNGTWFYVKNGVYTRATTFCPFAGQKYYVKNGIAQTGFTGNVTVEGKTYRVENGVLAGAVEENLWKQIPDDFTFCSGAGAWSTGIRIADDGTFKGDYGDSDMGDTGPGYPNGIHYTCTFSGKFTQPRRISQYVYQVELVWLKTDRTPGLVEYRNGIKYVWTDPYGMEDGKSFYIFLPGMPISELPEDFLLWGHLYGYDGSRLPDGYYGLFNINTGDGFVGGDYEL